MVSANSSLPGICMATLNWPPTLSLASNKVTWWPHSAATVAADKPAGPAPTTATLRATAFLAYSNVVSWQARGLTRQLARWLAKVWSRQAWLQPIQVLISSLRPEAALATKYGSAKNGRAIDTRSQSPRSRMAFASCGILMRFEATTGMLTSRRSRPATLAKAARGTEVTMVGTRASCQP